MSSLSRREATHILLALRNIQDEMVMCEMPVCVLPDDEHKGMDLGEIDDLCEKINFGDCDEN